MANSDKDLVITPNRGSSTDDPKIVFSGATATSGAQNITVRAYATCCGTVSFEGSAGQLFSVTNCLTGTIFSVNDISGIPSIDVNSSGQVRLAPYGGYTLMGKCCNVNIGFQTGNGLTTGVNNTGVGYQALYCTTTGSNNIGQGYKSLFCNTTGASSIAMGFCSLYTNNATGGNIAIGCLSAGATTTGANNIGVGQCTLRCNTIGSTNIATGFEALKCNTTGSSNIAQGYKSLIGNTTGYRSVAVGHHTLLASNATGCNIAIGYEAACTLTTGIGNLVIGYQAQTQNATSSNQIIIGTTAYTSQFAPSATWSALSDSRDKAEVETITLGIDFIREIRPVKFKWQLRGTDVNHPRWGMPDSGFLAQELLTTANKWSANSWLKIASDSDPEQLYADPGRLLPVIVKAIQDLDAKIEELRALINP